MAKISFNKNFNIGRVVSKITITVIALWVGGVIIRELGNVMLNTSSPFYRGLTLIGWSVSTNANASGASDCGAETCAGASCSAVQNCITDVNGAGVLAVVGIIGIASIVLEFVNIRMG